MGMALTSKEFELLWKAIHDYAHVTKQRPNNPFERK